jgi:hypothetical protein
MQKLSLRLLITIGLIASLAVGCQNQGSSDLGKKKPIHAPKAVKPAPAPVAPEIKPPAGKAEAESCAPLKDGKEYKQSDCDNGLVCAPNVSDLAKGTCRVSCGELSKGKSKKVEGKCASDRTCQLATSLSIEEIGAFCLPVQTKRDGACSAMGDDQACSNNRLCAVSELKKNTKDQPVATSFICRDACAFATPKANDACSSGEKCAAYPYQSTPQHTGEGEPVMCTETKCTGDFAECECDRANGFQCTAMIPGVVAFCDRPAGICTTPVGFTAASDFSDGGFTGEKCNEVKGHAFCNSSLFDGVAKGGEAICVSISEKTGDGFCYAFCSAPAVDLDGDGKLKGRELGQKFNCPANYKCNTELGRMLGMVASVGDKSGPDGKKSCDPTKCEAGKACPGECGLGDAECLSFPTKSGESVNFCGAPFGNCELSATPL